MAAHLAWIALGVLVAGCSLLGEERPELGVSNGTTLVVVLTVNGQQVGEFRPGDGGPDIDEDTLPPMPWMVEARTVTGRVLTSMVVRTGDVFQTDMPDGSVMIRAPSGRVDLSCGRLDIWAGFQLGGPAPGPGVPGDCEP